MTQGEVSVKIEEGGEGEAVSNGDDSSPTEETNAYDKWPQAGIKEPTNNDVLYGRGGGTNHHQGNKRYRLLVEEKKVEYVNSKRLDKPVVALNIVKKWREQSPPGRFLKLDEKKGTWSDVGDKKAREKTSQALREKAPQIRQELEAGGGEGADRTKRTTFDVPEGGGKPKGIVRDHSLGKDFINPGDPVDIGNFDWDEPVEQIDSPPPLQYGMPPPAQGYNFSSPRNHINGHGPSAPGHAYPQNIGGASQGWGSGQFAYIEPGKSPSRSPQSNSSSSPDKPPNPAARYIDRPSYPLPHPHSSPAGDVRHLSSSGFHTGAPPHGYSGHYPHGPSPSFPSPPSERGGPREHSLSAHPLRDGSTNHSAQNLFASNTSGVGGDWQDQYSYPPPPGGGRGEGYEYPPPPYGYPPPPPQGYYRRGDSRTYSHEKQYGGAPPPPSHAGGSSSDSGLRDDSTRQMLSRPQIVKRDTSHQAENEQTKRRVQRSRLVRDHSLAAVALSGADASQEALSPREYEFARGSRKEDSAVKALGESMRQSSLAGSGFNSIDKPRGLTKAQRLTTVEAVQIAFADDITKAARGEAEDRNIVSQDSKPELIAETVSVDSIAKPRGLTTAQRLTTVEAVQIAFADDISNSTKREMDDTKLVSDDSKPELILDRISADDALGSLGVNLEPDLKPLPMTNLDRADTVDKLLISSVDDGALLESFKPPSLDMEGKTNSLDDFLSPASVGLEKDIL